MEILDLLNPHELYVKTLKEAHIKNTEEYFDNLVNIAKVNVEENRETIKELKEAEKRQQAALKKEKGMLGLRVFLIIMIVLLIAGGGTIFGLAFYFDELWMYIVGPILVLIGIGLIFLIVKKINPEIKLRRAHREAMDEEVKKIRQKAYGQMMPLNALFDWNIPASLVTKTCPLIKMDKYFDVEKYEYLHEKYGYRMSNDIHRSVVNVQSGSIEGNPFFIQKVKIQDMVDHTYTGSITISWTEYYYSDGKRHSRTRTQTLTASVTKPKPRYYYETWLVYGNDAAPDLTFTRVPSPALTKDDKQLDRYVEKKEKKLDKLAQDTLMDDKEGEYTKMANVEFDVLFGAQDRDNEREFRLLFTPLAQQSMLKLIKEDKPYGDDFKFIKRKCLNYIYANHSQNFDFSSNPAMFVGYDVDAMKKFFVDYNDEYFRSLFFQLAPLLSIPLYQQQRPIEYIYQCKFDANVTSIEHEVMANSLNYDYLRPEQCITDLILKTNLVKKNNQVDSVSIKSYGYQGINHTSYIEVYGGDGKYHTVPVHWVEYVLVETENQMEVSRHPYSRKDFTNIAQGVDYTTYLSRFAKGGQSSYQRGLLSILLNPGIIETDMEAFKNIFNR